MRFYRDVLGEEGHSVPDCVRMIFYVADVDAFWEYLRGKDLIQRVRETAPGASDIFICLIRIATGCRLHARSSSLSAVARTHPVRVPPRHVLEFP
jgi:hypothetical protein